MTIIILNVPTSDELPTQEWLKLAVNPLLQGVDKPHGCVSADGTRMHIVNKASPFCDCGNEEMHKNFNHIIEIAQHTRYAFSIDRRLLVEALAGIDPDGAIRFFVSAPNEPIVLQGADARRTAIIMPMICTEENPKPEIPYLVGPNDKIEGIGS